MIPTPLPPPSDVIAAAVGVDPGATYHAFSLLLALRDGRVRVARSWYAEHDRTTLGLILAALDAYGGAVFVETARVLFPGRNATQLLETKENEGRMKEAMEVRGWARHPGIALRGVKHVYVETSADGAGGWRRDLLGPTLLGIRAPMDPVIEFVLRGLFTDRASGKVMLPPIEGARHADVHVFDAIGNAYVGLARLVGAPLPLRLPKALHDAAVLFAMKAKAEAQAKKAARALNPSPPRQRRKLSRKTKERVALEKLVKNVAKKGRRA